MSIPSVDMDIVRGELRHQTTRADELQALLVRVTLCRELFAQLPADLKKDIHAVVRNKPMEKRR